MNVKVFHKQSLLDICLQYCGTAEFAYDIAKHNNIELSQPLEVGMILEIPNRHTTIEQDHIVKYYQTKGIAPASGDIEQLMSQYKGISQWVIGLDFRVS